MADNAGYMGNALLKKQGVDIDWTPELVAEYVKCSQNGLYFVETYMHIININDGLVPLKLFPFQRTMFQTMADNRFTVIATARQVGKALPLDTNVPTPGGWKTIGELQVGDLVFTENGTSTLVTATSPIFEKRDCYKITFDDKTSVIADSEHLWAVSRANNRNKTSFIKTTKELFEDPPKVDTRGKITSKWCIPNTKPIQYPKKKVLIDPYTLGMWLGDGSSADGRITCCFEDLVEYKQNIHYEFSHNHKKDNHYTGTLYGLNSQLKEYNLLNNKHIPLEYLQNDVETRLALLQGLMDTDGYTQKNGNAICLSLNRYPQLVNDVYELLVSFGFKVFRKHKKNVNADVLWFNCSQDQFTLYKLSRKLAKQALTNDRPSYTTRRFIRSIEKIGSVPTKCISVDSRTHLFLCSKNFIPTHNSTITCAFILWYILFHPEKTIALLANKGETAREIMGKIQLAYQHLPAWLQQGVKEWNKGSMVLENNSRVIATATSTDSIRGYTINMLFIDEAAFIENWDEFFTSVGPTISAGKDSKIVLVSTPHGLNHFYAIWTNAINHTNDYKPICVPWWDVPGRDERWKEDALKAMNFDQAKFEQEYCVEFQGSSGTLIAGWKLKDLLTTCDNIKPLRAHDGLYQFSLPEKDHTYFCTVDVSRGKGLDYSAFHIIDCTKMPYKQVCTYDSNMITPGDYADIIHKACLTYNNAYVLVEINDIGEQVSNSLHADYEYEYILFTENAGRAGKRITTGFGAGNFKVDKGIRTTKMVKALGCSLLKLLVEQNQLEIQDLGTVSELTTFARKGVTYEAEEGKHDDLVMGLVLFAWLSDQQYFKDLTNINTIANLRDKTDEELMAELSPFGFVDNHQEDIEEVLERQKGKDFWLIADQYPEADPY